MAADHQDEDVVGQLGDGVEHRHEVGSDDEDLGLGVADDECDLRRGEAPVDVDRHGVAERRAVHHLEVLDAVLVEERNPVLVADTGGGEAGCDAPRPLVELRPRDLPIAENERDGFGFAGGVGTKNVGDALDGHGGTVVDIRHTAASPRIWLSIAVLGGLQLANPRFAAQFEE